MPNGVGKKTHIGKMWRIGLIPLRCIFSNLKSIREE